MRLTVLHCTQRFVRPNVPLAIALVTLYLIDCCRVCYLYFTERPEFSPITSRKAYRFFTSNAKPQNNPRSFCELIKLAKPPSILSLPVWYCSKGQSSAEAASTLRSPGYGGQWLSTVRQNLMESLGSVAIVTTLVLVSDDRQVDYGFFCGSCWDKTDKKMMHYRIKYMTEETSGHITRNGRIVEKDPNLTRLICTRDLLHKA